MAQHAQTHPSWVAWISPFALCEPEGQSQANMRTAARATSQCDPGGSARGQSCVKT